MKKCRVCSIEKKEQDFPQNLSYKDGKATVCKLCSAKEAHRRRTETPHIYKAAKFKTSPEVLKQMLLIKHCEICGGTTHRKHLAIDHNHKTGIIRGMLCDSCNQGLGKFKDSVYLLQSAINYLEDRDGTTN